MSEADVPGAVFEGRIGGGQGVHDPFELAPRGSGATRFETPATQLPAPRPPPRSGPVVATIYPQITNYGISFNLAVPAGMLDELGLVADSGQQLLARFRSVEDLTGQIDTSTERPPHRSPPVPTIVDASPVADGLILEIKVADRIFADLEEFAPSHEIVLRLLAEESG